MTDSQSEESTPENNNESTPPILQSEDLLQGGKEVLIKHGSEVYHLRLTRNDKLILQK